MYHNDYKGYYFFIFCKDKGFSNCALFVKEKTNCINFSLQTDSQFSILTKPLSFLKIRIYAIKIKKSKNMYYDLSILKTNRKKFIPFISTSLLIDNPFFIRQNNFYYSLTFSSNRKQNNIYISNPYISVKKDIIDYFINNYQLIQNKLINSINSK